MTQGIRWTEHTRGLAEAEHQAAERVLGDVMRCVRDRAEAQRLRGTLVVGGSLARGEAAILPGDQGGLLSDVDFVAVAPAEDCAGWTELIAEADRDLPGTPLSVFHVAPADARQLGSYFGADAAAGPVVIGPKTSGLRARSLGHRADVEVVVHQASNLMLVDHVAPPAGAPRTQRRAVAVKLALEALRVLGRDGQSLARLQDGPSIAGRLGLDARVARQLLEERNRGLAADVEAEAFARAACRAVMDTLLGKDVVTSVRRLSHGVPAVVAAYQAITLCWASGRDLPHAELLRAARGPAHDPDAAWVQSCVERIGTENRTDGLLELRARYYGLIGPHNFGRAVMSTYDASLA